MLYRQPRLASSAFDATAVRRGAFFEQQQTQTRSRSGGR
jgi:hypothetical protein